MAQVSKAAVNYERAVARCANCKHFIDRGTKEDREDKTGRRFKCGKHGFNVNKIACCDDWADKRTGIGLDTY